jgi:hypothetical protein
MRNVFALPHTVSLIVPSTINGNEMAPLELIGKVGELVLNTMIGLHGGCTITEAKGGYRLANGQTVVEDVLIYKSSTTNVQQETMFDLAETVCQMMTQESVAVEINGVLNLVSVNKLAIAA